MDVLCGAVLGDEFYVRGGERVGVVVGAFSGCGVGIRELELVYWGVFWLSGGCLVALCSHVYW